MIETYKEWEHYKEHLSAHLDVYPAYQIITTIEALRIAVRDALKKEPQLEFSPAFKALAPWMPEKDDDRS